MSSGCSIRTMTFKLLRAFIFGRLRRKTPLYLIKCWIVDPGEFLELNPVYPKLNVKCEKSDWVVSNLQ